MIKIILIFVFIMSGIINAETVKINKDYLSKEAELQKLTKNMDYWINSPIVMEDSIVFFFKEKASKVYVSGNFNSWKHYLPMEEKETNFWIFAWDKRLSKGVYQYKLIVDEIWINDPNNTNFTIDDSGQEVSYFELKDDFIPYAKYPLWLENGTYLFKYDSTTARDVFLVGDFNNWNPFNLSMTNKGAGEFYIKISLKPGLHTYCFVVDGEWKTDPNNRDQYSDEVGNIVNTIYIKKISVGE